MKRIFFFFPIIIFIIYNIFTIINFGYYHDDWGFFNFNNQSFFDHSEDIWMTEGILLHRYINVPFYILGSIMPNPQSLYIYIALIGFVIYFQIFDVINYIFKEKNISNYLNCFGLSLLIVCWYFFPFNISGQFWATNIHVKVCFFFFLLHFQFLLRNKILYSIISIIISFSSYEMFYMVHLPISFLIYKFNLIHKDDYKRYLIYSSLAQLYFLLDRLFLLPTGARPDHQGFELLSFVKAYVMNFVRFFWSINMSFTSILSPMLQAFIFLPTIYFLTTIKESKNFYKIFLIIVISIAFNSAIVTGGGYGYEGNGIFSKTFYYSSFFIFIFFLLVFVFQKNKINKIFLLFYVSMISFIGFYYESKSWIKSWELQQEIFQSKKILELENNYKNKNLVIFFGPCRYNGVEVFYAPWDLTRSIREFNKKTNNDYIPLTNWKIEIYQNKKDKNMWLGLHNKHYEFPLIDFDSVIFWDYFKNQTKVLGNHRGITLSKEELDGLNAYRSCDIETDNYNKNKIDAKKLAKQIFQIN